MIPEKIVKYSYLYGEEGGNGNRNIKSFLGVVENRAIDKNPGNAHKREGDKAFWKF